MKIKPVILSGGSGTFLWQLSRKQYPDCCIVDIEEVPMTEVA
ncbi:sugar phosphate nucleotidyltransferase [Candidatus Thioglobus sp.]|nr:sugar phosphate nucleotidyltransferase [Candidatus Thioglobus sp.]